MRLSLLYTIACKHKKSVAEVIKFFGKNVRIYAQNKIGELELVLGFLSFHEIKSYCSAFPVSVSPYFTEKSVTIKQFSVKFFLFKILYKECRFKYCSEKAIAVHNVKSLQGNFKKTLSIFFLKKYPSKIYNFKALRFTFGWKHVSLCKAHNKVLYQYEWNLDEFRCDQVPIKFLSHRNARFF